MQRHMHDGLIMTTEGLREDGDQYPHEPPGPAPLLRIGVQVDTFEMEVHCGRVEAFTLSTIGP